MKNTIKWKDISEIEKREYINQTDIFCKWFSSLFNVPVYLIYGTLLGCIRENDFIDNDDDVDLAYLSRYNKFEDVYKEMLVINIICSNLGLIKSFGEGSNLPRFCGHSHIFSENKKCIFDVWTSWIDEKGNYNFYTMGKNIKQDVLLPLKLDTFRDKTFLVPNKSEELLSYLYTDAWKTPLDKKSHQYRKDYWRPLIDIYKDKLANKEIL